MAQSFRTIQGTDLLSDSRGYLNDNFEAVRSFFAGATAPSSPVAYMLWFDSTSGYVKERNAANDAWIVIGKLGTENRGLLSLSGGTMTGAIDMGGFSVTNLALGTGTAAARQQELDLKAPLAAPVLTGDATVTQDPAGNNSLTRRSWTEARYLKITGGTMTGAIVLSGNAAADLQAVPRQQLRDFVTFHTTTGHRHDGSDARKVKGSSVDSEASAAKSVLMSDGASGSSWSTVAASSCVMRDNQELLISRTTPIAWTTFSLATWVPVETVAAILKIELTSGSVSPIVLKLRPTGTTPAVPQEWSMEDERWNRLTTMVGVSSRQFDYMMTFAGSGTIAIYLLGYIRTV